MIRIWLSRRGCTSGPTGQQICNSISTQDRWTATGIGSGLGVFVALIAFILLLVYLERRKKRRNSSSELGDEEDGGVIDPHRIDIDTTPQSYYAGEVEMRNGIMMESDVNKKNDFDNSTSHLYPPPPATIAHNLPSSSAKSITSIPDHTLIRNDSGSSSIPSPPIGTDSLDVPPPAYVEKSSNQS